MSTVLDTITSNTRHDGLRIQVTSYSGGKDHGQMIQLSQLNNVINPDNIKLDTEQVQGLVHTLQLWLNEDTSKDLRLELGLMTISRDGLTTRLESCEKALEDAHKCKCHGVLMKEDGVQPHTIACEWEHNSNSNSKYK